MPSLQEGYGEAMSNQEGWGEALQAIRRLTTELPDTTPDVVAVRIHTNTGAMVMNNLNLLHLFNSTGKITLNLDELVDLKNLMEKLLKDWVA